MNAIPTVANGGVLLYVAVALLLIFLAAISRPSHRAVAIDGTHHKNNPDASIRQDRRAGAITTTLQEREAVMTDSTAHTIRAVLPDFDGRAPLMPADTPEFVLDAAPSWAARVETESNPRTGYVEAYFTGHKLGAVGKGITCQLRQFITVDPADGRTVKRDGLVIGLDYPTGSWIDIDPGDLDEVQRSLTLAAQELEGSADEEASA